MQVFFLEKADAVVNEIQLRVKAFSKKKKSQPQAPPPKKLTQGLVAAPPQMGMWKAGTPAASWQNHGSVLQFPEQSNL